MDCRVNPEKTKLETVKPNWILGLFLIMLGGIFIFPFSIIGFFIFILPGVGLLIFGISFIMGGIQKIIGGVKVTCPYCGKTCEVSKNKTAVKCSACKKSSAIKDGYAVPID